VNGETKDLTFALIYDTVFFTSQVFTKLKKGFGVYI
jgi:hypothetical protein